MIATLVTAALSLGLVAEPRLSFSSPGETLPVIVSRLAEELSQPLGVAQKLRGHRLVVYAPDVPASELLDNIAWSLHGEWVQQSDGSILLDRTPPGERLLVESQTPSMLRTIGDLLPAEVSEPSAQALDAWAADVQRLVRRINTSAQRDPEDSRQYQALSHSNPAYRFAASVLQAVAHLPAPQAESPLASEFRPAYVLSSRPSPAEIDVSGVARAALARFQRESQARQKVVAQFNLLSEQPQGEYFEFFNFESLLNGPPSPETYRDFAIRVGGGQGSLRCEILFFDADRRHVATSWVNMQTQGHLAARHNFSMSEVPRWFEQNEVTIPFPLPETTLSAAFELLASPGGFDQLFALQYEAVAAIGERRQRAMVVPLFRTGLWLLGRVPQFDVAMLATTIQVMLYEAEHGDGFAQARDNEGWIVVRYRAGGELMTNQFWPEAQDAQSLQEAFAQVKQAQVLNLPGQIQLARAAQSADFFGLVQGIAGEALQSRGPMRSFSLNSELYSQLRLLADIVGNDLRRLDRGHQVEWRQLSDAGQELLEDHIYTQTFLGHSPNMRVPGALPVMDEMPTQMFPDGIPPQTSVSLEVRRQYRFTHFQQVAANSTASNTFDASRFAEMLYDQEVNGTPFPFQAVFVSHDYVFRIVIDVAGVSTNQHLIFPDYVAFEPLPIDQIPAEAMAPVHAMLERFRDGSVQLRPRPPATPRTSSGSGGAP